MCLTAAKDVMSESIKEQAVSGADTDMFCTAFAAIDAALNAEMRSKESAECACVPEGR